MDCDFHNNKICETIGWPASWTASGRSYYGCVDDQQSTFVAVNYDEIMHDRLVESEQYAAFTFQLSKIVVNETMSAL
jgi:hypothetical protein